MLLSLLLSAHVAHAMSTSSNYYVSPGVKRVKTSVEIVLPKEKASLLGETVLLYNLNLGSRGQDVIYLQEFINNQGYKINQTGVFGLKTRAALKSFQREHEVELGGAVSGVLDTPTRSLINRMLR